MSKLLRLVTVTAALTITASVASAAGLNFAWNDCPSGGGVQNKTFACASNTGTNTLVGSFIPPVGVTAATGIEVVVDLLTAGPAYADWWAFRNVGTCRQTALSANADFTGGPSNCTDYFVGAASGGLTNFESGFSGTANRARIKALWAVPPANAGPLDSGTEYYAFKFNISNAKTVGTGACTGCTDNVCLVLNMIRITQPVGVGNFDVSDEATSRTATWQSEVAGTCLPVPARNRTWGSVKALYR